MEKLLMNAFFTGAAITLSAVMFYEAWKADKESKMIMERVTKFEDDHNKFVKDVKEKYKI